jgi:hypothetical protein
MLKCLLNNKIGNDLEERRHDLTEVIFLYLHGGTREYDGKTQELRPRSERSTSQVKVYGVTATRTWALTILT